jgi:hypothetical protein
MNTPYDITQAAKIIQAQKNLGAPPGAGGAPISNVVPEAVYVYQNARFLQFDFTLDNTANPAIDFQIAQDIHRNYLIIQNNSAAIMYVSFTGQTGAFTSGLQIPASQCYEPNVPPRSGFTVAGLGNGVVVTGSYLA